MLLAMIVLSERSTQPSPAYHCTIRYAFGSDSTLQRSPRPCGAHHCKHSDSTLRMGADQCKIWYAFGKCKEPATVSTDVLLAVIVLSAREPTSERFCMLLANDSTLQKSLLPYRAPTSVGVVRSNCT